MILVAQFPGGNTQVATPKTAEELSRIIERRDELRGQLESANHQRQMIADQLQSTGSDPAIRDGLVTRLKAVDARIGKLERDIESSDNVIAQAKANGVSTEGMPIPEVPTPPPAFPLIPGPEWITEQHLPWRDRVLNSLDVIAPMTIATVVLLGALLYWRISRSVKNQFNSLLAMQQSRLEEIQRSVDTVAVEIERVSENQRFVTKLVGERPAERR